MEKAFNKIGKMLKIGNHVSIFITLCMFFLSLIFEIPLVVSLSCYVICIVFLFFNAAAFEISEYLYQESLKEVSSFENDEFLEFLIKEIMISERKIEVLRNMKNIEKRIR